MRRIKVLGITGGVGAGKSTVLAYLKEKYHAEVLQLDEAAHIIYTSPLCGGSHIGETPKKRQFLRRGVGKIS